MKDEEMAEEFATKECCATCKNINHSCKEKCECWIFAKKGFLAGLKAGRQWHKVADGDLPKDEKDMLMSEQLILLTRMKGTNNLSIIIGQYNFSTQEFSYPHLVGLTDVIAWCEIPTFDKE